MNQQKREGSALLFWSIYETERFVDACKALKKKAIEAPNNVEQYPRIRGDRESSTRTLSMPSSRGLSSLTVYRNYCRGYPVCDSWFIHCIFLFSKGRGTGGSCTSSAYQVNFYNTEELVATKGIRKMCGQKGGVLLKMQGNQGSLPREVPGLSVK